METEIMNTEVIETVTNDVTELTNVSTVKDNKVGYILGGMAGGAAIVVLGNWAVKGIKKLAGKIRAKKAVEKATDAKAEETKDVNENEAFDVELPDEE